MKLHLLASTDAFASVAAALVAVLAVRHLLVLSVYFDARQLRPTDPKQDALGLVVPVAEFVVILYYVSERGVAPETGRRRGAAERVTSLVRPRWADARQVFDSPQPTDDLRSPLHSGQRA
ncbi:hypothetical protein [Halobellus captivus]|uniref:hypothetical protein n=1 Tax=Halobellus captivus TaxID=2592614 RepID=UPI00119D44E5|nr:hypothetical protein [Halobellus captivus]